MLCRCCGSPRLREHCKCFDAPHLRYLRCMACGSMNLSKSYADCVKVYNNRQCVEVFTLHCGSVEEASKSFTYHLDALGKLLPNKGAILDVGCLGGAFMFLADKCGWESWGFDVSEESRDAIVQHAGLPAERIVVWPEFRADDFDRRFAAVHCSDVIEHVESPRVLLSEMRRVLAEDGVLFVQSPTPDGGDESIWNQDVHLCIMPEDALRWLLYDVGFWIDEELSLTWLREWDRPNVGRQPSGGQCYFCRPM